MINLFPFLVDIAKISGVVWRRFWEVPRYNPAPPPSFAVPNSKE